MPEEFDIEPVHAEENRITLLSIREAAEQIFV